MVSDLTTARIADLLAEMLTDALGGDEVRWLELIGPVTQLPLATHIHCNWSISPIATGEELRAIRAAEELLRGEHPYVHS